MLICFLLIIMLMMRGKNDKSNLRKLRDDSPSLKERINLNLCMMLMFKNWAYFFTYIA